MCRRLIPRKFLTLVLLTNESEDEEDSAAFVERPELTVSLL
jgi:hypothetical protein